MDELLRIFFSILDMVLLDFKFNSFLHLDFISCI